MGILTQRLEELRPRGWEQEEGGSGCLRVLGHGPAAFCLGFKNHKEPLARYLYIFPKPSRPLFSISFYFFPSDLRLVLRPRPEYAEGGKGRLFSLVILASAHWGRGCLALALLLESRLVRVGGGGCTVMGARS